MSGEPSLDPAVLFDAICRSWSSQTSTHGAAWSSARCEWGQCDVSAFLVWEYLGGSLVLGEVFVDGERTEHHYWNRLGDMDVDLTEGQFGAEHEVREVRVVTGDEILANLDKMRPDLKRRIAALRTSVDADLAERRPGQGVSGDGSPGPVERR